KQPNNTSEPGASVGGPIVKDRLFFFASVSPQFLRRTQVSNFSNGTEPGTINLSQNFTQAFGKISFTSSKVQGNASFLTTPKRVTGTLPAFDGNGVDSIASTFTSYQSNITRGFNTDQYNFGGDVAIWLGRSNYIQVRGGLFRDN